MRSPSNGKTNPIAPVPRGLWLDAGKIFQLFLKNLLTSVRLSAIISSVENIGASPSGKASDSDSDISGVRIPVPQPTQRTPSGVLFALAGAQNILNHAPLRLRSGMGFGFAARRSGCLHTRRRAREFSPQANIPMPPNGGTPRTSSPTIGGANPRPNFPQSPCNPHDFML